MRSTNLKVALVIYGAIYITQGIILLVDPDRMADFYGFGAASDQMAFIMAITGSAFIVAGVWFAMTFLDPIRNINSVRFAILWASLMFITPLYALWQDYIEIDHIWLGLVLNAIFAAAFLIFYPRRS
jgi:glycerol-3-phosphate acyltransferase PlsY